MDKFDLSQYTFADIGKVFDLKGSPDSNITYKVKLGIDAADELAVQMYASSEPFDASEFYLAGTYETSIFTKTCKHCDKKPHGAIMGELFCEKHYKIERRLIEMCVRDFLYKLETEEDLQLINDRFLDPYIANMHDEAYPTMLLLHSESDECSGGEYVFGYFVRDNMADNVLIDK